MLETPHTATPFMRAEYIIKAACPPTWNSPIVSGLVTLVGLITPFLLCWICKRIRNMHNGNANPFPFLELPPELRDMVYENLLEDPYYPPPPACARHHGSPLNWMLGGRWPSARVEHKTCRHGKRSNWIFLANKQIYAEYMDVVCKKTTFHLTVSPHNYTAPTAPATEKKKIWKIRPQTLKQLRKCDIKLITTSNMLGVSDPRTMNPKDWVLAKQMREELKEVENVQELNLHVKAIGDPLWNPLWVWYHASQSLKTMGNTSTNSSVPVGPKLNRITFSLDMWSPGENFLKRDPENKSQWAWWCMKGHCVGADGGAEMTVREFCSRLYMECRTCRPELDSDEEEEDEE